MAEATEAAVRLASEHDIDLAKVEGTGAEDKIVTEDVQSVVDAIEVAKEHGYSNVAQDVPPTADPGAEHISDDDPELVAFVKKVATYKATSRSRLAREARRLLDNKRGE